MLSKPYELFSKNIVVVESKLIFFFFEFYVNPRATSQAVYQVATLDDRDDSLDVEYWTKYPNVIDERRERLWDALLSGLQKY